MILYISLFSFSSLAGDESCHSFHWNIDQNSNPIDKFFYWKKHTVLKLYSSSDFSLKPKLTINDDGIRDENGLICTTKEMTPTPWQKKVPRCDKLSDLVTGIHRYYIPPESNPEACRVVKLSHYVRKGENVVARVRYDDQEYFVNPADKTDLLDSKKVSTKEDRETRLEEWSLFSGWSGSCSSDMYGARKFPETVLTQEKDYVFFSLSGLFGMHYREGEKELRFFKGKQFSTEPDYVLDIKGLRKKDGQVCKWKNEYSEMTRAFNYLDCKEGHDLIKYFSLTEANNFEPGIDCSVMVPKLVEKKDDVFSFKFQIGSDDYYLDTTSMPRVANGHFFSTLEKRNKDRRDREEKRQKIVKENIGILKSHLELAKLKDCIKNNNSGCLKLYLGDLFINEVLRVTNHPESQKNSCDSSSTTTPCLKIAYEDSLEILKRAIQVLEKGDFNRIYLMESGSKKIFNIKLQEDSYPGVSPESIDIEIDGQSLKLPGYTSGLAC